MEHKSGRAMSRSLSASQPAIDWARRSSVRGRKAVCGMVLLAAALARRYFGAAVPAAIEAAEGSDPMIAPWPGASWRVGTPRTRAGRRATRRCRWSGCGSMTG